VFVSLSAVTALLAFEFRLGAAILACCVPTALAAVRGVSGVDLNQSAKDTGIGRWTMANRSIDNTDVVLWYVFGIHHITRPEDWPVMPVDVVSFWLKPFGFFDRNPSLDVVAAPPDMCHTPTTSAHH
jgi:primary-amine oxidase